MAQLLGHGEHVTLAAVAKTLVYSRSKGLPLEALGDEVRDLRRAFLDKVVRLLSRWTAGAELAGTSDVSRTFFSVLAAKYRARCLRVFGGAPSFWTEMEECCWGLEALALLYARDEHRDMLMAVLREIAVLTELIRSTRQRRVSPDGIETFRVNAEIRACEALAYGLAALSEDERMAFCAQHLIKDCP
jgi:hypothetical protein